MNVDVPTCILIQIHIYICICTPHVRLDMSVKSEQQHPSVRTDFHMHIVPTQASIRGPSQTQTLSRGSGAQDPLSK